MKTKVEKHEISFIGGSFKGDNLFKLTITKPTIGVGKDYIYYFKGSELEELIKQIKEVRKENE